MQDHKNTIAGWVLFAGIIVLGASIVTGEVFHSERPEKMGFPIEGVVLEGEGGAAAEKPIDFSVADVAKEKGKLDEIGADFALDTDETEIPFIDLDPAYALVDDFDPRFPDGLQLAVTRVTRDEAAIAELAAEIRKADAEVEAMVAELTRMQVAA